MIRFSALSKLLLALSFASLMLNILQPGDKTYYGMAQVKQAVRQFDFAVVLTKIKPTQQKTTTAIARKKDCKKLSEYDRLVLVVTNQSEPQCGK